MILFGLAVRTLYSNATLGLNDANRVIAEFWRGNTELYSFQQAWAVSHTNHSRSVMKPSYPDISVMLRYR
jgi:hypothetical protein